MILSSSVFAMAGIQAEPIEGERIAGKRPNILVLQTDDQSWLHTGYHGDPVVRTPNMDRLAKAGVVFENAYCSASSCAPSRAALFTGRNFWELGAGANLHGMIERKFTVFPEVLQAHGYQSGYTGKGYGPQTRVKGAQTFHVLGGGEVGLPRLSNEAMPFPGMNPTVGQNFNYSGAFEKFLSERENGKPFVFYCGFAEPHLPYHRGSGEAMGLDPSQVLIPPFLADHTWTRRFFVDYYFEIEYADRHIGQLLESLERHGELDNTLIIFTSDNGMAVPRGKGTCYDWGVRVPFFVYWKGKIQGGRSVSDFINLTDLAPTLLEIAGVNIPREMTGRSFLQALESTAGGRVDAARSHAYIGKEKHNPDEFFPMRAIRTDDFLYIHNFNPDMPRRWTKGEPPKIVHRDHPNFEKSASNSPAEYLILARDEPTIGKLFDLAYGPQPGEELYDVRVDEFQLNNLADDPRYAEVKAKLKANLFDYLAKTGDPRIGEDPDVFQRYYEKYAPESSR